MILRTLLDHLAWESISPTLVIQQTLKWSLVASTLFHIVVVLGISFVTPEQVKKSDFSRPLKIILVNDFSKVAPDQTETLAQANSLGQEDAVAKDPARNLQKQNATQIKSQSLKNILSSTSEQARLSNRRNNQDLVSGLENRSTELIQEDLNLIYRIWKTEAREKYITPKSKENHYAAYMEKWRLMVERVGNLNYPEAARQQRLEGSLVLDVEIRHDGSVRKINVIKSSGHKTLDDAAKRIVQIAAPFDRFPDEIRVEVDTLHIVRSWEFGDNVIASRTVDIK